MIRKIIIVSVLLILITCSYVSASNFTFDYGGNMFNVSLEGPGVINSNLSFNLSGGYIVPNDPCSTYTIYNDTVGTFYTQPWEATGGGAISIIYDTDPYMFVGEPYVFKMWYQAGVGTQSMGYAESTNGTTFVKLTSNPVVTGYFGGDVVKNNSVYYMFASSQGDLAHVYKFFSTNGVNWTNGGTVITKTGSWCSSGLLYQDVWMDSPGNWKMLISGTDGGNDWGIGLWEATDPNGTWTASASNPVIVKTPSGSGSGLVYLPSGTYKDPLGYTWTWTSNADTPNAAAMHTDSMRYRTVNPNDLTSWTANPTTYLNVGPTRYAGYPYDWQGRSPQQYIRVGNLTYGYYTYGITDSPGYEGLLITPLRIDQIVTTNEMYPNLTYQQLRPPV